MFGISTTKNNRLQVPGHFRSELNDSINRANFFRAQYMLLLTIPFVIYCITNNLRILKKIPNHPILTNQYIDIAFLIFITTTFLLLHILRKKLDVQKLNTYNGIISYSITIIMLTWAAVVSACSHEYTSQMNTYFAAILLTGSLYLGPLPEVLSLFLFSTLVFIGTHILTGFSVEFIFSTHVNIFSILPLSFLISRMLYNARVRSLVREKEYEIANEILTQEIEVRINYEYTLNQTNDQLEGKIKERTTDLENINKNLREEVSERKRIENKMRDSLEEKEILLKEIHHRVKNNLSIIKSLLDLQADNNNNPWLKSLLMESRNRIFTMALVHERLYESDKLSNVDMKSFTEKLISDLFFACGDTSNKMKLNTHIEPVFLNIEQAIPCGLIMNECITNAIKYACEDQVHPYLEVDLKKDTGDTLTLHVKDGGPGFPSTFDVSNSQSLGISLIQGLSKQLGGTLNLHNDEGAVVELTFPLKTA